MSTEPELFRALGVLCEPPEPAHTAVAAALDLPGRPDDADYTDLFVLQLVPYAAVYTGAEGMLGGDAADRVAGFWRALRLTPPAEPDHLAALLGLYAALAEAERAEPDPAHRALRREARRALLWEHLLTWVVPYAHAVRESAGPFHARWAEVLSEALLAEAAALDAPAPLPAHLRAAPALPADDDGLDALVRAVLTPVRSGLLLTRRDLARGAREAGLAARIAERSYALRGMLDQDPFATVRWLTGEAERWAAFHAETARRLGGIGRHWLSRAESTRALLVHAQRHIAPPLEQEVLSHAVRH